MEFKEILSCYLMTSSGDGPQEKSHGSYLHDKVLQFLIQQEAKIVQLDLQNKKLQEELSNSRGSQLVIAEESQQQRATISRLQKQNDDKEETIKRLTRQLAQYPRPNDMVIIEIEPESRPIKSRDRRAQGELTALQNKISEMENREMSYKATIASLEDTAHKRLIKTSRLQRALNEKRAEVFSLHHRLIEYVDWVAELRGAPFIPLPSYLPNQKPPHKRVRDSWRKMWARTCLHMIPEESQTTSLY
ncbi:uncharacterized protein LOC134453461 [Engraulis encrasicolus]|uniref:uncharacterized protein LOC134453461 n=1 Tax=Engraulis encrasicolus TaxID=184585 RepID=UPI002FD2C48B